MWVKERCVSALGSIANSSWEATDYLLQENLLPILLREFKYETQQNFHQTARTVMLTICSSVPAPRTELISSIVPLLVEQIMPQGDTDTVDLSQVCQAINTFTKVLTWEKRFPELLTQELWENIVRLLDRMSDAKLELAVLGLVRQMVSGGDSQIETVICCGGLAALKRTLNAPNYSLVKLEAFKILSSIATSGNAKHIEKILQAELIEVLLAQVTRYVNQQEATWVIIDLVKHGNQSQIQQLVDKGCIETLVSVSELRYGTLATHNASFVGIYHFLERGEALKHSRDGKNPYSIIFNNIGGFKLLSALGRLQSPVNQELISKIWQFST